MKNVLLLVPLTVMLTACGSPSNAPSVDDLVADQALYTKTVKECGKMSESEMENSEACTNVMTAAPLIMEKSMADLKKTVDQL